MPERAHDAAMHSAQLRPIHAQTGAVGAGVGSAVFELGGTRVLCAVYGPQVDARQEFSERGRLACEVKVAAFARLSQDAPAASGADESALAAEMHTALAPSLRLEAYPKSSWQLCAFVVEDDGSALPALINCASLALADAGVEMFDLVAACSVVRAVRNLNATTQRHQRAAARCSRPLCPARARAPHASAGVPCRRSDRGHANRSTRGGRHRPDSAVHNGGLGESVLPASVGPGACRALRRRVCGGRRRLRGDRNASARGARRCMEKTRGRCQRQGRRA